MKKKKKIFLPSTQLRHSISSIDKGIELLFGVDIDKLEDSELESLLGNLDSYLDVLEQKKFEVLSSNQIESIEFDNNNNEIIIY